MSEPDAHFRIPHGTDWFASMTIFSFALHNGESENVDVLHPPLLLLPADKSDFCGDDVLCKD